MAIYRCKMCGGDLEVLEDVSVVTCEFCGTGQTIPTVRDENIQALFNRANILRMKSEFDRAAELYEKIIQASEKEAEAYWGLILCKYGIEYVEDPATFKRIPTCHRTSYEAVTADENYKKAIQYADVLQRAIYETEAKAIEEIQKGILAISQKEEPYDVFICYKETDADGKRTVDSAIANEIYHELTQEGFKVFYAAITLEDRLGTEYEPYIFSALNSAKVMILLGTRPEYFNAVWVKNEWSRFLKIMEKDRSRLLVPCYRDMDAYELPEEFAHLQAQDMSKIGFINDVIRGIKKVIAKEETEPAEETAAAQPVFGNSSMRALLDRGYMALEDGEWENANEYFDQVLNMDAKCGDAYLGRVLAESKVSNLDSFSQSRLRQYETVKKERCEACDRRLEEIKSLISDCVVEGYLEFKDFEGFFDFDLHFDSKLVNLQNAYEKDMDYLTQNKLINRTLQFLEGKKKELFSLELEKAKSGALQRLEEAKQEHEKNVSSITEAYKNFFEEKAAQARAMSWEAKERKRLRYEEVCKEQASASFDSQYELIAKKFEEFGNYQAAEKRAAECRKAAEDFRIASNQAIIKNKQRKLKIAIAVIIAIVAVWKIIPAIANKIFLSFVQKKLIGEKFTGECIYEIGVERRERKFEVVILDERYCNVEEIVYIDELSGRSQTVYSDDYIPYTLTGGVFGIKFNWDSDVIEGSDRDFFVIIDGDDIKLETEDYTLNAELILSN